MTTGGGPDFLAEIRRLCALGRQVEAVAAGDRARGQHPSDPWAALALAEALIENGELARASSLLTDLAAGPQPLDAIWLVLARLALVEGRGRDVLAAAARARHADPSCPQALILAARGHILLGDLAAAELLCNSAGQMPGDPSAALVTQAILFKLKGQGQTAIGVLRTAHALAPEKAEISANLALMLHAERQIGEAEQFARQALDLKPHQWKIACLLARICQDRRDWHPAAEWYRQALRHEAGDLSIYLNLSDCLRQADRPDEAMAAAGEGLKRFPDSATLWLNLGAARQSAGLDDAAMDAYEKTLALDPACLPAFSNLMPLLSKHRPPEEAESLASRALAVDPEHRDILISLASAYFFQRKLVQSRKVLNDVLTRAPHDAVALALRAIVNAYLADHDAALADETAIAEDASSSEALDTARLYLLNYHPTLTAGEISARYRSWGARHGGLQRPHPSGRDDQPDRRLRIGYVSPDFRRHTSRFYFEPLFANHDPTAVELFAYANMRRPDDYTVRFQQYFHHWRPIHDLSDDQVAERVAADKIDILIDCTNHMQSHRLLVFARKPAPIQATWLGSIWTSGLAAMDYTLQDPFMAPPGSEAVFVEKIWRLPHSLFCFRPPDTAPAWVAPLPALTNGHLTFGYFGRTERLNDRVFRVWGRILNALPGARLVLDFRAFNDPPTADYFRHRLAAAGVPVERVTLAFSNDLWDALSRIDVMLDSFPHSGGTMLFDGLWAGLPALTLAERPPCGRIGAGLMMNLDLPQWVVRSEADYIARAVMLASDIEGLAALRAGLRHRMRASPLMDEAGFAKAMEVAYRGMWRQWCIGGAGALSGNR